MAQDADINIWRVVGRSFDVLVRNAPVFFGLAALLVGIPTFAVTYWVMSEALGGRPFTGFPFVLFLILTLGSTFLPLAAGALLQGFVAEMVTRQLSGLPAEPGRSIRAALSMVVPLLLLSFLFGLIITIGLLVVIVPGIIFYLVLIAAVPAMIIERKGVIQSMVRSEALTSGAKGMIFLLMILLAFVWLLIGYLAGMLGRIAIEIVGPGFVAPALAGALAESIRSAVVAVMVTSLYVELRSVKEGDVASDAAVIFE